MENTELQHTLSTAMRQRWYDPKIREIVLFSDEIGFMNLSGEGIKAEDIPNHMAVPAGYVMCLSEVVQNVMDKKTYLSPLFWGPIPPDCS